MSWCISCTTVLMSYNVITFKIYVFVRKYLYVLTFTLLYIKKCLGIYFEKRKIISVYTILRNKLIHVYSCSLQNKLQKYIVSCNKNTCLKYAYYYLMKIIL